MKRNILLLFSLILMLLVSNCNFVDSFSENNSNSNIQLYFDKSKTSIDMGAMDIINLVASENQNSAPIFWNYDKSIIHAQTDNYSAVITGLKPGTTTLSAFCGSNSTSCIITVSDVNYAVTISNPYVYASSDIVNVKPNETVKISAALFGGTIADINGYTWNIDKPSVASLTTEGNYCWITGLSEGIAKITVRHNKSAFGYSVLVNCSSDGTNYCYITTAENIITINLSENDTADFGVSLENCPYSNYFSSFEFKVLDSNGTEVNSNNLIVSNSGIGNINLTAKEIGDYNIRCHHPFAVYDLDILVRVIKNAEISYIEPSESIVTVSDVQDADVSVSLKNFNGDINPALFEWSFSNNVSEFIDYNIINGSSDNTGDRIFIKGKKTGTVKITINYPGVPSRSIVCLVRDIQSEAADATCYISTFQNYIKLKKGDSPERINVFLKNSDDINSIRWTVYNEASDGSDKKVINWKSGTGSSESYSARSVLAQTSEAYAIIEPVNAGKAYIDISHPKALYSTRITVIVTESSEEAKNSVILNYNSSPVHKLCNGETLDINISCSDYNSADKIIWNITGNGTISGNGTTAMFTAPAKGAGITENTITVRHPDFNSFLRIIVMTFDTTEELESLNLRSFFSYNTSKTIYINQETELKVELEDFETVPQIKWNITEGNSLVALSTRDSNKTAVIKGLKEGKAVIKASCTGFDDIYFNVTVKKEGMIDDNSDCYLTTTENVLYFEDINKTLSLTIQPVNISSAYYYQMCGVLSDNNYDMKINNNVITLTSLSSEGSAILTVKHPLSQNELTIYLKTGRQFEFTNQDSAYISTSTDVLELYAGQNEVSFTATLNHTQSSDSNSIIKGFTFECDNESVASVSYVNMSNTCYVKPHKNGTAKIKVKHTEADFEKEVVVIVNPSPDVSSIPYITTKMNVITVIAGNYEPATVSLVNSSSININDWKWESTDTRIADIAANNGTSALVSGNSPGTAEIKISHKDCPYSLKIIVTVLDAQIIQTKPYIKTDSNIITVKKGTSSILTAEMIGGNGASDNNYFKFNNSNSSMLLVNASSQSCQIKGLNPGMAYITVTNSRYQDSYNKTVLVIVEDTIEEGVYIETSSSIIKLKPDNTSLTSVFADLKNGNPTDGEDFIWWCDDYNLIGITAIANQCSIQTTGRSGSTKIHVKHPKASKQADIIVMISNYDTFSFNTKSASICAEKLYFIPLHIPYVEEKYSVKYSSSNEEICIIQGSNEVAWVCGRNYGTASLTASIVTEDNTIIATTEMLVTVNVTDPVMPVISLGNSILTVEAGTNKVIEAFISGEGISESEKFNLKWSIKDKKNGISILDETPDKTAYGSSIYVNFDMGGEYVIKCEHEKTGAVSELYVIVEEKGEIGIELSSALETIYKDDGSITISAILTNATDKDYKNIEWSATKSGGQSIVAVSKAKGANCTVTPKNLGQATVIAKLPNGKTAQCLVIVKGNTEITFETGAVHVIPGYTEVINYKTNPENATVNWYSLMTTSASSLTEQTVNYFTIDDDPAKKQLRITGIKEFTNGAAGTVTASMVGASSANLPSIKVYVEYNVEVRCETINGNTLTVLENTWPDTANVKTFNVIYYPKDLDIDIMKGNQIISCIPSNNYSGTHNAVECDEITIGNINKTVIKENGFEKIKMSVSVIPHTECNFDITVKGTLPTDLSGTYSKSKAFVYNALYDHYDIDIIDLTKSGAFTKFKKDSNGKITELELGDGEEAVFYMKIKNENAAGHIETVSKDNWINTGNMTMDAEYSTYAKPGTDRTDSAKKFFQLNPEEIFHNIYKIGNSKYGLIYFQADSSSIPNTTVYHLSHGWDYYKDLPLEIQGNDFETYKEAHVYSDNFISELETKGVDYWLVTKELVYEKDGITYYAIPHPGKEKINANWENEIIKGAYTGSSNWDWETKETLTKFSFNNDLVYTCHYRYWSIDYENINFNLPMIYTEPITIYSSYSGGILNGNVYDLNNKYICKAEIAGDYLCWPYKNERWSRNWGCRNVKINQLQPNLNVKYENCTPYVITTKELKSNESIVVPSAYQGVKYSGSGENWGDHSSESGVKYLSKLIHKYIAPTVSKEMDKTEVIGTGTLTIHYIKGAGVAGESKQDEIKVKIIKRDCEAYTSDKWETETAEGNIHWLSK